MEEKTKFHFEAKLAKWLSALFRFLVNFLALNESLVKSHPRLNFVSIHDSFRVVASAATVYNNA